MVSDVLSDDAFVTSYLAENSTRLARSCALLMRELDLVGVPYLRPSAGMFLWVNLTSLLPRYAVDPWAAEELLYSALCKEAKVVLTPGSAQHAREAGWFRICFAFVPLETLQIAIKKLKEFISWAPL